MSQSELKDLVHNTVVRLARRRQLPWATNEERCNRIVGKIIDSLRLTFPDISRVGDSLLIGKRDPDSRFAPATEWFDVNPDGGILTPREA